MSGPTDARQLASLFDQFCVKFLSFGAKEWVYNCLKIGSCHSLCDCIQKPHYSVIILGLYSVIF